MKNIKNIIEQKYPPENPNDLWMKDNVLYKSTHKGWTPLTTGDGSSTNGVTSTTWQELKDKRDAGKLTPGTLYRITDYNCTTTQENTRSAGHQFDIVLLALSENKLAEEGWAMMHDNIYDVTFDDGVTKKCWIHDNGNNPMAKYNIVDAVTLKGLVISMHTIEIDEEHKTAVVDSYYSDDLEDEGLTYDYFQNSNLSAWKVWYCLDNDKSRFAWADGGSVQPATITVNNVIYTDTGEDVRVPPIGTFRKWKSENNEIVVTNVQDNVTVGTTVYSYSNPHNTVGTVEVYVASTLIINGRGVIYRLIDEFNNDIKYDFKNIQFKRKLTDGSYDANGTETWCYTLNIWYNDMCQDASIVGNTMPNDEDFVNGVFNINLGVAIEYDLFPSTHAEGSLAFMLNDIVFCSYTVEGFYYGFCNISLGGSCYRITFGNNCKNIIMGNYNFDDVFKDNCFNITMGHNCTEKTFNVNTTGNFGNGGVELATKDDLE